jgi:hypothetical protein
MVYEGFMTMARRATLSKGKIARGDIADIDRARK